MSGVRAWLRSIRSTLTPRNWVSGLLLSVSICPLHAQQVTRPEDSRANYVQMVFNSRRGLPQDSVHAIAQGSDHFLWFATEEGFARYDGVHAETYDRKTNPELNDNNITALAAAPDGSVWVATRSSVLRFLHGRMLSRVYAGNVNALLCDEQARVWVGTEEGLARITQDGRALDPVSQLAGGITVISVLSDRKGGLWLLTSNGLVHFAGGTLRFIGNAEGMPLAKPTVMVVAPDGSLWLAGNGKLLHWSGSVLQSVSLDPVSPEAKVTAMLRDASGDVWVGFDHYGLAKLHGTSLLRYTTSFGLPSDDVSVLLQDESGNIWVGLRDEGAVSLHSGLFRTYGQREGVGESKIWTTLAAHDGSVWIGMNTKGLDHLHPNGQIDHYTKAQGFPFGAVLALYEDDDHSVWAGLDTGTLAHVTGNQVHVYKDTAPVKAGIRGIVRGPGHDLYVLYRRARGIYHFHNGRLLQEKSNIPDPITFATSGLDGSVWLGTDHAGVTHWKGSVLEHFAAKEGLPSESISSIYVESRNIVWVATTGGLSLIRQKRVTNFTPANGLDSFTIGSVLPDSSGYLWMSSNKGISKALRQDLIDFADGRITHFPSVVYGTSDGMRNAECNYGTSPSASRAPDGRLWYATAAGATSIDPGHSTPYAGEPEAEIESLSVDGKPVSLARNVVLKKGEHDLQVNFTAPDFIAANHLRFRYRLQGFDSVWNDAGSRRQAIYTHLPPGDYTLQVQAQDGQGWPHHSSTLMFMLPPYFWQTAWFRVLGGISILLAGYGVYRVRVYSLRHRGKVLQECVVQRTAELQEAIRQAEAAQQKLREQATLDSLTRLWNRSHIFELLQREATRAEREHLDLCVLMLDVDHFKHINDTLGHLGGDRVLEQIAAILVEQTREYDYAGRYGGEEFLVVLCNCTLATGMRRSEAIRAAIASAHVEYDGTVIPVTASFGVAEVVQGRSIEHALKDADLALYRAKHSGKNRVCSSLELAEAKTGNWFDQQCDYAM